MTKRQQQKRHRFQLKRTRTRQHVKDLVMKTLTPFVGTSTSNELKELLTLHVGTSLNGVIIS